jgi:hypothetical protein
MMDEKEIPIRIVIGSQEPLLIGSIITTDDPDSIQVALNGLFRSLPIEAEEYEDPDADRGPLPHSDRGPLAQG